jgi:glucose-1-phosphate adenylyltransferase
VIGRGSRLRKVIIDKHCNIPPGTIIGENPAEDARRFHRSENGVVLVTRSMFDKLKE